MNFKLSDALLAASMAVCASGVICGVALISESVSGDLQNKPARATQLFFAALGLTHVAVLPLQLASSAIDQEQA